MEKKILCIGSVMTDIICPVEALPHSGEGVVSKNKTVSIGGCAFNTANAAKQAGGHPFLFAPMGRGIYSDFLRGELKKYKIEALQIDTEQDNGACICLIEPNAERTMITIPGIEQCFENSWFKNLSIEEFSTVTMSGYEINGQSGDAILNFLEANSHLEIFFAPGPTIASLNKKTTDRIISLNSIWHLNALEASIFTGESDLKSAGYKMSKYCHAPIIITNGEDGSYFFGEKNCIHTKAIPIKAIDTVGAGDAHLGAVLSLHVQGYDWDFCLKEANKLAACTCMSHKATLTDKELKKIQN